MSVPAPGLLSTITCCPHRSVSRWPIIRASVKTESPARNGTMIRMVVPGIGTRPSPIGRVRTAPSPAGSTARRPVAGRVDAWCSAPSQKVLGSVMRPVTADAATVSGLPRNGRASRAPKRPGLLLVAVEIDTSPASSGPTTASLQGPHPAGSTTAPAPIRSASSPSAAGRRVVPFGPWNDEQADAVGDPAPLQEPGSGGDVLVHRGPRTNR